MTQKLILLAALACFAAPVWAQDVADQVAETVEDVKEHATEASDMAEHRTGSRGDFMSNLYVVGKVFTSPGQSYEHSGHRITGDTATGFGLDFGYKIGPSISAELAYSSGSGDVKLGQAALVPSFRGSAAATTTGETTTHEVTDAASYSSLGLLGVYSLHLGDKFAAIGKLGMVSESEDLGTVGGSSSSTGVVYVLGCEYKLFGHNELVLEYEDTTIDGPRAYTLFVGWKVGFGH
ncbi:MAG: hypothetical protein RRB13_13870 [bacterium]|nr:hypothetical protein [bacterium]